MSNRSFLRLPHGLASQVRLSCVCTTPLQSGVASEQRLANLATWFDCKAVARQNRGVAQVLADEAVDALVVADLTPKLYHRDDPSHPLFFHPGMAAQRIARLQKGQPDRLVTALGLRPGQTVIDATLGLGTDSLVLAYAVGEQGRVMAIEASWLLARLFQFEQHHPGPNYRWLEPLLARIDVVIGNHTEVLTGLPARSADAVLFDPMFRLPPDRSSGIEPARNFTMPWQLDELAWQAAQRVARDAVLLKERPQSREFVRFGITPDKPRARFAYGVWHQDENRQQ